MTPEQRRVGEIISGTRKGLGGPFSVWVRILISPSLPICFTMHSGWTGSSIGGILRC